MSVFVLKIVVGLIILPLTAWSPVLLLILGLVFRAVSKIINDDGRAHPEETRSNEALFAQIVSMGVVNIVASVFAGIGASLFVNNGHLYLPTSQTPLFLIFSAVFLIVGIGGAVTYRATRPMGKWITDPGVLRAYLQEIMRASWITDYDLADIRNRRDSWRSKTSVQPLKSQNELHQLGLDRRTADAEWSSREPSHEEFARRLRTEITNRQVRCWVRRKRVWSMWVSPWVSGLLLARIVQSVISDLGTPWPLALSFFLLFCAFFIGLLRLWALGVGRLDLATINRLAALERKQLRDCDQLISEIQERYNNERLQKKDEARRLGNRVVIKFGRWILSNSSGRR